MLIYTLYTIFCLVIVYYYLTAYHIIQYPSNQVFWYLAVMGGILLSLVGHDVHYQVFTKWNLHMVNTLHMITFLSLLICISWVDHFEKIIPNPILVMGVCIGFFNLVFIRIMDNEAFLKIFLSRFALFLFMGILTFLVAGMSNAQIGMGDIKLFVMMGLYLNTKGFFSVIFLSVFMIAIVGILLIITGKKKRSDGLPMAPYLLLGSFLCLFMGQALI